MKKLLVILLYLNCLGGYVNAQSASVNQYLPNVVDIENNSFGFIVGTDNSAGSVFFVTVANKAKGDADLPSTLNIRYYKVNEKALAKRINRVTIGGCWVYLYSAPLKSKLALQMRSYAALKPKKSYKSYIDNGEVDSVWYASEPLFHHISLENETEHVLQTDRGNIFYKGMPLIDEVGSVVGLLTNGTGVASEKFKVPEAISMVDVAKKLYEYSDCKYFQLVEMGKVFNPCELAERNAKDKKDVEAKLKSEGSIHQVAIGHSIGGNFNMSAGPNGSQMAGFGYALGMNVFFSPDDGKVRVVINPRFNHVPFRVNTDVQSEDKSGFIVRKFRANSLDMPVILEFVTKRQIDGYGFWGIGYVPGYQLDGKFVYSPDGIESNSKRVASGTAKFTNKVLLQIGRAGQKRRFSFSASYQFTSWTDESYLFELKNALATPYRGFGRSGYLSLGFEFSSRWSGKWGLK